MMIAHVIQQKSWTLKDGTTVSLSDREEESTEGFKILQYVAIDEIVTEKVKGEVSEWPPSVIKAEFGGETFYYNLAECHKKPDAKEQALSALKVLNKDGSLTEDVEAAHIDADKILCAFLRSLGHGDVVDEFEKVEKWYR